MSNGFDTQVSLLVEQLQTLRQIRKSASTPFFDHSIEPVSRIKRICEERERLSNSGLLNLRLSYSGYCQPVESDQINNAGTEELDISSSYTDIAYMLQSDYGARLSRDHANAVNMTPMSRNETPLQVQSELKRHVRQQSDARLQATFKLLSESIEEAGNLRALLEYSLGPEKIDDLLESVKLGQFRSDKENTVSYSRRSRTRNNIVSNSAESGSGKEQMMRELKYRALLLEQGSLLDQVQLHHLKLFDQLIFDEVI